MNTLRPSAQIIPFERPRAVNHQDIATFVRFRLAETAKLATAAAQDAQLANSFLAIPGADLKVTTNTGGEIIRQLVGATMAAILATGCNDGDRVLMAALANWLADAGGRV
ncbi:hypothetical protein [Agrobacterium vitis]|uniref:hypothetical protein n=1 Tax=Agrobacterium vitis TaxID=373 RepID=UPI000872F436|nr:hypothetical protein [Agrobacterium vitis]MCM2453393.1 hypothetical protein [Agrobacterium vitis]MCM2470926.1 hypothetical protein [Agrobacterium vitis]MUO70082.1 hypothetical protein [Agrobacterium vitis]